MIGNPLNDGRWTYTWEHGRQLASMTDGSTTWTYTYNADGLRTKKTNGTTTYNYVYNGSSLTQMTVGSDTLYFAYDGSSPMSVTYNGTNYYYATNLQGDVVAILNSSGTAVVQYTYDAWGNILTTTGSMASTLGAVNPLTYRGYVFDRETGLYYLQSRYYNPEIGRFINADALMSTGQGFLGNNMFVYCLNNPIALNDTDGFWGKEIVRKTIYDGAGGGAAVVIILIPILENAIQATAQALSSAQSEIYAFSKEMRVALEHTKKRMPQVHHIIPQNVFSGRSQETQNQILEMHVMLSRARINRFVDPINLMLVSAGTHATLHTDAYIGHVYSYLKATDGSREQIYRALFFLRIEIAAQDTYSIGY